MVVIIHVSRAIARNESIMGNGQQGGIGNGTFASQKGGLIRREDCGVLKMS